MLLELNQEKGDVVAKETLFLNPSVVQSIRGYMEDKLGSCDPYEVTEVMYQIGDRVIFVYLKRSAKDVNEMLLEAVKKRRELTIPVD